jgi:hypothetical protein
VNEIVGSEGILNAREATAGLSLAQMYEPAQMSQELRSADTAVDEVMGRALGVNRRCELELERQHLLERYADATRAR